MFRVKKFDYNGFYAKVNDDVYMLYTAEFIKWTEDPGIGLFKCSDGKERLIPSCALIGLEDESLKRKLPKQEYKNEPRMFGAPSNS